jgi:hypothetical protein
MKSPLSGSHFIKLPIFLKWHCVYMLRNPVV